MSNFLAIATVTATLSRNLYNAVVKDVQDATVKVTSVRPDDNTSVLPTTGVNVYLYQISPNAAWRNSDLPSRSATGEMIQRPKAALDLHYLLTFYGDDTRMETQRLLGSVVRTLYTQPILTRTQIRDTLKEPQFNSFLLNSDLADDIELVRFSPLPLSLEELSKVWSVFLQTPYALSIAYQGSVVLIESEDTPASAPPVRVPPLVSVRPWSHPTLTSIEPQMVDMAMNPPIKQVTIRGNDLRASATVTTVQFNGLEGTLVQEQPNQLQVLLPAQLRAGIHSVQVILQLELGKPTKPHPGGFESNVAALVVQPKLDSITFSKPVGKPSPRFTLTITPQVDAPQKVLLLLNQFANPALASPKAFTLQAQHREKATDPIIFDASNVATGTYLVRIRVDGADSSLVIDTNPADATYNQYVGPTVIVP